jgi:hypothetical protein
VDLASCGIDTGIRLSAFFGNLCEGLVRAIPGFSPKAYGAAFEDVMPTTSLGDLMELLVNVDANPRGMPKPEAAAPAPAPVAASAPAAADEAHPGVFSKFKGLFGGRH